MAKTGDWFELDDSAARLNAFTVGNPSPVGPERTRSANPKRRGWSAEEPEKSHQR
jgi:hypothetical protein